MRSKPKIAMKLWTFIFPDPAAALVSARIAAPDRTSACILLGGLLDLPSRLICQASGSIAADAPKIVSVVERCRSLDLPPTNPGRASGVGGAAASETKRAP